MLHRVKEGIFRKVAEFKFILLVWIIWKHLCKFKPLVRIPCKLFANKGIVSYAGKDVFSSGSQLLLLYCYICSTATVFFYK